MQAAFPHPLPFINMTLKNTLRPWLARRLTLLSWLVLAAFALSQIITFWFVELFSHFLPHYTALWAVTAAISVRRQRWLWAVAALAGGLWLCWPSGSPEVSTAAPPLKVLWYNVNLDNPAAAQESAAILAAAPDVVAMAEIDLDDTGWQTLRQAYPHGCEHRDNSPFALALWSRRPLQSCRIVMVETDAGEPFPFIETELDGSSLFALHPPPPINAELAAARQAYLQQAARKIAAAKTVLVMGDLNSSPFSPVFRQFTHSADIRPRTPNYLPTWLPFGLNIDHVLTRGKSGTHIRALPWMHSDHRALLIEWP